MHKLKYKDQESCLSRTCHFFRAAWNASAE